MPESHRQRGLRRWIPKKGSDVLSCTVQIDRSSGPAMWACECVPAWRQKLAVGSVVGGKRNTPQFYRFEMVSGRKARKYRGG